MAQFDIYPNPNLPQRQIFPFVVQVQHDFFDALPTRLVVPLQRATLPHGDFPRRLTEPLRVQGEPLFMAAHLAAALPTRLLRGAVANARDQQFQICDAFDAVMSGV